MSKQTLRIALKRTAIDDMDSLELRALAYFCKRLFKDINFPWKRITLMAMSVETRERMSELDELRMHGNAAPYQIRCIIAQLSVVVTIFDDNTRHGEPVVLDGSFSIPATQVRPCIEPPWAIITSEQVAFGIAALDADYGSDRPYAMLSEEAIALSISPGRYRMRCPLHGEQAGKTCLACAAERERRERAHALLALTVALAIVLIVAISHYAPGVFPF